MFKLLTKVYSKTLIHCSYNTSRIISTPMNNSIKNSEMSWPNKASENLVWMDLEMTGLNVEKDQILEVACLITNSSLNVMIEGPDIIIHQPDTVLESMNAWCIQHHGKSGLTEASRNSKVSLSDAEQQILDFLKLHIPPGKCPLAGNSVYMDRIFLQRYMPLVDKYLHYRIVDVSTIKELCKRWNPVIYNRTPQKILCHRALSDIKESVKELQYYQSNFFKTSIIKIL
ncbi:hypothetical protein L9F63_003604 [Diploptera punctata]|uniref:Probable oligoribonuclease n=1 Tax=Diploptera punctata TaxID=6984 RepID=A0AAD7ZKF3_DIPPU|nr:hypothetical protein L9F63_003604 [Diploptera punctata]